MIHFPPDSFATRSEEAVHAPAADLQILAAQQVAEGQAPQLSIERLALTLRTELAGLDRLFSL